MATSSPPRPAIRNTGTWMSWVYRQLQQYDVTPLDIALLYTVLGFLSLFLSDVLLVRYLSEPFLSQVQALKGGLEVVLTAGFVFALTRRSRRQLQHANDELARQREELSVLHRVLRHNLRNDLNVILGYAEMIKNDLTDDGDDPRCEAILAAVDEMLQYTERAKHIRQVTNDGDIADCVDLADRLPDLLDEHSLVTDAVTVRLDLPEQARVSVNPMFDAALGELIANAIEHNDSDRPTISISVVPDAGPPDMTTVRIADNGPGIPQEEREALQTGTEDQLRHLTGMGLWLVRLTITESGGDLEISTSDSPGTSVEVQVPKALDSPLSLPAFN